MRKCISFLLIFGVVFSQTFSVSANTFDSLYMAQKSLTEKTKYAKYIPELEESLPKLSQEKLKDINKRVSEKKVQDESLQNFLSLIEIMTLNLLRSETESPKKESSLSWEEIQEISSEITLLQNTLLDEGKEFSENLFKQFKDLSRYKQSGDFSLDLGLNIPNLIEYSFGLEMKDYVSENQVFDSKTQSDIKLSANMKGLGNSMSGDISWKIDVISKDGVIYLKAEDISYNMSEMMEDTYKNIIEKINTLGSENTYIQYDDEASKQLLKVLKNINSNQIATWLEKSKQTPLFTSTEKSGAAYKLTPTKAFCSLMKEAMNIFDPFAGKDCSDAQYQDMLEDFTDSGVSILLTPGANKLLSIVLDKNNAKGSIDIRYSEYGLISIMADIYDPENKDINHITFSYLPQETLSFHMKTEEIFSIAANMKLDNTNALLTANFAIDYKEDDNTAQFKAEYNYGKLHITGNAHLSGNTVDCNAEGVVHPSYGTMNGNCKISRLQTDEIHGNMSFSYDMRSSKNNLDFDMNVLAGEIKMFSLNMKNTGTQSYISPREIPTPEKTVSLKSLITPKDTPEETQENEDESSYTTDVKKFNDYTQTCYNYDNGDYSCEKVYENKTEVCEFFKELGDTEELCYEYKND